MNKKILAYITVYEDRESTQKCITGLSKQSHCLDNLLIIDNSYNKLDFILIIPHLIIHYPENIGISGGLNIAIQWAIENNFDFLWTFDQDSQPSPDCLEILLAEYEYLQHKQIPVAIIAPTIIDCQTQIDLPNGYLNKYKLDWQLSDKTNYYRDKLYQCDVVITSGSSR